MMHIRHFFWLIVYTACSFTASSSASHPLPLAVSRTIACAATVGYVLGRIVSGKTPPAIAGSLGAVAAGTISACTLAPYVAYRHGGSQGLLSYATLLAIAILWRETSR